MAGTHPIAALGLARALVGRRPQAEPEPAVTRPPRGARNQVFLAEHYLHDVTTTSVDGLTRLLTAAAADLRRQGADVRVLGAAGLPADEALLHLLSAPSAEAAARAVERAGLSADRIVPVLWSTGHAA